MNYFESLEVLKKALDDYFGMESKPHSHYLLYVSPTGKVLVSLRVAKSRNGWYYGGNASGLQGKQGLEMDDYLCSIATNANAEGNLETGHDDEYGLENYASNKLPTDKDFDEM